MSLPGALAKLQKKGTDTYLQAAQFFSENNLIRETWIEMSRDLERQAASLKSLPAAFWTRLKADEATLNAALELWSAPQASQPWESKALTHCLTRMLEFEEPLILRTYVPLIRVLRTEWTDRALDFYIMVKAHVARLTRIIEPFSGDPALTQRAANLMQVFEREVQVPAAPSHPRPDRSMNRPKAPARDKPAHDQESGRPLRSLAGRGKGLGKRSKPLVKKIEIPRRQARRG